MYSTFYDLRDHCESCGYVFEPGPGEFTGALMFAQGVFGLLAALGFIVLWSHGFRRGWLWAWVALSLVLLPLLTYPSLKGAWFGFLRGMQGKL